MKTRAYSELRQRQTFEERFEYLNLAGVTFEETFGKNRWINQRFYTSREWRNVRDYVIFRDEGCDLGVPGYEIHTDLYVHHMNAITADDILNREEWILDPEFLITTSRRTHNAIHYGDQSLILRAPVERRPGDTRLW